MPNAGLPVACIDQCNTSSDQRDALIDHRRALIGGCVGKIDGREAVIGHCCAGMALRAAKWHEFRDKWVSELKRWAWLGDYELRSERHVHAR